MKLAIVDDNKLEQELIFNTLRTYEHERNISLDISSYSDGNSFLNTYVPGDFDLIFLDIYLNELNGIDNMNKIYDKVKECYKQVNEMTEFKPQSQS